VRNLTLFIIVSFMKKLIKFLLSSIAAVIVFVPAFAQVTTSSMSGKITDQKGEVLAGATVVAVHVPSGTQYFAVANSDGRFSIQGMRPGGPYEVTASLLGFEPVKSSDVFLTLGETAPFSAALKETSTMLDAVVVSAEGGVDANKTGAAQSINSRQISEMPSITRGIADVARINPFVRTDNSGAMTFAGINNRYNSFQIDGAMNNDVFGLTANGSNGGQAGTQPVSMETIDQVQVSIAPFDVRQSGFTGGAINAISKSGTNTFHASVYGFGNNQILYGRYNNAAGTLSDKYSKQLQYQAGLTVGGPIVKDKLFFFASFETANNQYPNSYGLGSSASKIDAAVAKEVYDIIVAESEKQGYKYTGALPSDLQVYTKSNKASAKIDWNINNNNHFSFRWSLVAAKQLNSVSGAAAMSATDYSYEFQSNTNSFVAELQSKVNDNQNNEVRFSYVRVRDKRNPLGAAFPMIEISGIGDGKVDFGNERSSEANRLDQDIFTLTDNYTWTLGNHNVTAGFHGELYKFTNLFIQDIYGSYYYDSVDDFKNGEITRYRYQHCNTAVTGSDSWEPTFRSGQVGIYAQDKWSATDKFDLTYGLRIDVPIFIDKPTANEPFAASDVAKKWGVATDKTAKSTPLFSPRVGFRYDIAGDRNFILRGGVGLFTGRIPYVWFSNNYSNTGIQFSAYDIKNGKPQDYDLKLQYNPADQKLNEQKLLSAASGSQLINVVDPNFKIAQNLRADLAFDFKVAGINMTLEGIFSKNLNDVAYKQLAYGLNGKTLGETYSSLSFDNRPMYLQYTKGTPFANIYMLTNTNKGYSYNLMASASKSFKFGLDVSASYTFTRSKSAFNATSSVAQSNWNYNYTHADSNDPELGNSAFNIPHQVKVNVSYHKSYGRNDRWTTTAGAVLIGTSGAAYCIYYNGDINGDSSNGNDLIFIPTDEQINQMSFKATTKYSEEAQRANLKGWLANTQYLKDHRGEYFDRYADNMPFETHIDIHLGQKFSFMAGKQKHSIELTFDFVNFANLLNPNWGRSYGMGINSYFSPISYSGNGQFQFLHDADYTMFNYADNLSRWRGQLGLKYSF